MRDGDVEVLGARDDVAQSFDPKWRISVDDASSLLVSDGSFVLRYLRVESRMPDLRCTDLPMALVLAWR